VKKYSSHRLSYNPGSEQISIHSSHPCSSFNADRTFSCTSFRKDLLPYFIHAVRYIRNYQLFSG